MMLRSPSRLLTSSTRLLRVHYSASSRSFNSSGSSEQRVIHGTSFNSLIMEIPTPSDHYRRANAILPTVRENENTKNVRNRTKQHVIASIDALMKALTMPVTKITKSFRRAYRSMHPFEKKVVELTMIARVKAGEPSIEEMMTRCHALIRQTNCIGQKYIAMCKDSKATSTILKDLLVCAEAELRLLYTEEQVVYAVGIQAKYSSWNSSGTALSASSSNTHGKVLKSNTKVTKGRGLNNPTRIDPKRLPVISDATVRLMATLLPAAESIHFTKTSFKPLLVVYDVVSNTTFSSCLNELVGFHKELRRLPVLSLTLRSVILIGAPNVGKSSIVRAISTGTPEVNNYPFTTRGVSVGHILPTQGPKIDQKEDKIQVMDTPGILDRNISLHNEIEHLTYATVMHFPNALLVYVIDPTSLAGEFTSSLANQLNIRSYLKATFPEHAWADVLTKDDLFGRDEALQEKFHEAILEYNEVAAASETVNTTTVTADQGEETEGVHSESLNRGVCVSYPYHEVIRVSAAPAPTGENGTDTGTDTSGSVDALLSLIDSHFHQQQ